MHTLKKIAIVGPESTGKSNLAESLADHFGTAWVPEFARYYLDLLPRPYLPEDLPTMARGQLAWEAGLHRQANHHLFCDTNLLVYQVWSEFKYGYLLPSLKPMIHLDAYDFHLLTDIDLPWQDDPQREHPHTRKELFDHYLNALREVDVPFAVVSGSGEHRLEHALWQLEQAGIASSKV